MGRRKSRRTAQRDQRRAMATSGVADSMYRASSQTDSIMSVWNPPLNDPNSDWAWERTPAVARTRDLVANNPYAGAAVDQAVAMQVGNDLRYSARHELMAQRLGITVEQASELATQIERAWDSAANDKLKRFDWHGRLTFGQIVELAARHLFVDGDALAVLRWDKGALRPGWKWRTSLQLLDPDRLENPNGLMNSTTLVNGVELDAEGRFVAAYHIRNAHPADRSFLSDRYTWERVPARESWGRPIVLHVFDPQRAGQLRGVSKFVRCLRGFKALEGYTDKELAAAAVNALHSATITTPKTATEAGEMLGLPDLEAIGEFKKEFYGEMNIRLPNGGRVIPLAPGDELKLDATPRHVASFQGFVTTILQGVAASLGLAASQLTMDFSKTNFSSWRGEMLQVWRGVLRDRALIASQFCDPILLAVIEEAIDNGEITPPEGCPALYECTTGWLAGRWIGPSRGTIDPAGEVDGAVKRIAAMLSTHEDEALELGGGDYQAIAGQLQWEVEMQREKGLQSSAVRELMGAPQPGAAAPTVQPENVGKGNVAEPPPESPAEGDKQPADAGVQ